MIECLSPRLPCTITVFCSKQEQLYILRSWMRTYFLIHLEGTYCHTKVNSSSKCLRQWSRGIREQLFFDESVLGPDCELNSWRAFHFQPLQVDSLVSPQLAFGRCVWFSSSSLPSLHPSFSLSLFLFCFLSFLPYFLLFFPVDLHLQPYFSA
jgi:hypothetical protein